MDLDGGKVPAASASILRSPYVINADTAADAARTTSATMAPPGWVPTHRSTTVTVMPSGPVACTARARKASISAADVWAPRIVAALAAAALGTGRFLPWAAAACLLAAALLWTTRTRAPTYGRRAATARPASATTIQPTR